MDRDKTLGLLDKALGGAWKVSFSSATPPVVKILSISSPRQECNKEIDRRSLSLYFQKVPSEFNVAFSASIHFNLSYHVRNLDIFYVNFNPINSNYGDMKNNLGRWHSHKVAHYIEEPSYPASHQLCQLNLLRLTDTEELLG